MAITSTRKQFSLNLISGWVVMAMDFGVAMLLTPYIVMTLGAAAYGVWSLMNSVIGYLGLIDIGIRGSIGRYINHYLALDQPTAVKEVVGTSVILLTVLSAVAGLAAIVLAGQFHLVFPKTPDALLGDIGFALPLLAVGLWLSFMTSIFNNLVMAKEALYLANLSNLIALALRTAGVYWVLSTGHGLKGLVVVSILTSTLGAVMMVLSVFWLYGAGFFHRLRFSLARLKEMWRFGIASFISRTASTMANDSAPIIGMWTLGPEPVAIYSLALTLTQNARRVIEQASSAIFPSVMKAGALRDLVLLREIYLKFMNISFAIGALVFIGLMVFTDNFLLLWVGPQYHDGATVVAIIALGYLLMSIASTMPLSLAALDRIGITVRISLLEAVGCIVLTYVFSGLLHWGLVGLALGTTLPRIASCCFAYPALSLVTLGRELLKPMIRALLRNALLCVGIGAAFAGLHAILPARNWWEFGSMVIAATAVYVLVLFTFSVQLLGVDSLAGLRRAWTNRKPK